MSYPIGVCCAQKHKLSQMNIWPVGLQDHFSQDPRNIDMWVGKIEKRYVKKGKQRWFMPISSHDAPKFGFGYGKM